MAKLTIPSFLKYYLVGKGIDTSSNKIVVNTRHWYREPNNLYRFYPKDGFKLETLDFVYNQNLLSQSKFYPVLFKEWFSMVRVGGFVVMRFKPNRTLNLADFKEEILTLMINRGEILYADYNNGEAIVIAKKNRNLLIPNDDINKWTFGIITMGKRDEWVDKIIDSIKKQSIPEYEIIICGIYQRYLGENTKYINFSERDDLGWITKKKNLICERAKYENLCITNDRILYNNDWFTGMKKYGNCFESLGCVQKLEIGQRVGDWVTFGDECTRTMGFPFKLGHLDYQDWDKWAYVVGSLNIIKKSIWQEVKWDETLYWKDGVEDGIFCHQLKRKGYLTRFNPYSSCLALSWRHGLLPYFAFNNYQLDKLQGAPVRRFGWFMLRLFEKLHIQKPMLIISHNILKKLRLLDFVINH